jgi:hypothetical protein
MSLHAAITEERVTRLGIPTGLEAGSFALTKVTAAKADPGWVVADNQVSEWRFAGITYVKGEPWLFGPMVEGRSLAAMLEQPPEAALAALLALARALALLTERGVPPFRLQTEAVIYLEEGGLLFLPPTTMALLKDSRPLEYRLLACEAVNHPYVGGKDGLSYTVAALAYRVLTGEFPFMDETEQGLRDRIRRLRVAPPHLVKPEVRPDASDLVVKGLTKPGSVGLTDWVAALEGWQRQSPLRPVSDDERKALLARGEEHRARAARSLRSTVFLEKNGRLILIGVAVAAVIAAVASSILRNALAPRVTRGLTAQQVVEAFYKSIGALDHATMEDCVVDGAGKAEINEAINLFVISRQTIAYEGKSYIVDAGEWDAKGRKPVASPAFVHGVTRLEVARERGEPEPIFVASYERYARAFEDQAIETAPPVNGRKVTDRLFLRQDKGDWVITRIERLRTEPLPR